MEANRDLLISEAKAASAHGEWERARQALARAIDVAPSAAELHAFMSWCTSRTSSIEVRGRSRLVEHHLAVSLEIAAGNAFAHLYSGRIWADQGNVPRAKLAFQAALRVRPD